MNEIEIILYAFYVVIGWIELRMFIVQRAALDICREVGADPNLRVVMLPASFGAMSWLVAGAMYIVLFALAMYAGWANAIVAFAVRHLASAMWPIRPIEHADDLARNVVARTDLPDGAIAPAAAVLVRYRALVEASAKSA